jgi:hypothetical protein
MIGLSLVILCISINLNAVRGQALVSCAKTCTAQAPCEAVVLCDPCRKAFVPVNTPCVNSTDGRDIPFSCFCTGTSSECICRRTDNADSPTRLSTKPSATVSQTTEKTPVATRPTTLTNSEVTKMTLTSSSSSSFAAATTIADVDPLTLPALDATTVTNLSLTNASNTHVDVNSTSTSQLVDVVTPGPTAISFPAWAIGAAVAGGGVLLLAIGVALLMLALRSKRLNSSPLSPSSSALHDDAPDMVSARMSSAIYDAPPVDFLQYGSAPPLSQDSMYDSPDVALKR